MVRIIVSIALIVHGIGHVIGVSASWTSVKMGFSENSWIFSTGVNIESGIGRAFGVVWLIAMIFSIAAGFGLFFHQDWWITLALAGAIVSIVAVGIWFRAFPSGSNISALLFDIVILVAILGPWSEKIFRILK